MNHVPGKIRTHEQRNRQGWDVVRIQVSSIIEETMGSYKNEIFFYIHWANNVQNRFSMMIRSMLRISVNKRHKLTGKGLGAHVFRSCTREVCEIIRHTCYRKHLCRSHNTSYTEHTDPLPATLYSQDNIPLNFKVKNRSFCDAHIIDSCSVWIRRTSTNKRVGIQTDIDINLLAPELFF